MMSAVLFVSVSKAFQFSGLCSFCFGLIKIYFVDSMTFARSIADIFSERYSATFSLLSFFIPIVNDVISVSDTLSSELSKKRLVKKRNPEIIIQSITTANVGFTERINHESTSPERDQSP